MRHLYHKANHNGHEHFDLACEVKLLKTDTPGTIEGYGSVFNLLDRGGDIVMPHAFSKSIAAMAKKGDELPMLWQHDPSAPIGVWTSLSENDKGLKVKGELILDGVPQAAVAHALLKRGAIKGLSIGYQTKQAEVDRTTGARMLKEVDLWEISLVTFPMMPEAQLTAVKAFENFRPEEMEDLLRDAAKLSRRDAKAAVSVFRDWFQRDVGKPEPPRRDAARDVLMELRKASAALRST
jgi:HK97 family phage prohead protease